jgi:hypothetical protein
MFVPKLTLEDPPTYTFTIVEIIDIHCHAWFTC